MLLVATILLFDTVLFLIIGKTLLQSMSVEDILTHFLPRIHWQIFVLFPWFAILVILVQPAKQVYQHNRRLYSACQWLLNGIGMVLMILGMLEPNSGVSTCGGLLCLWVWIADVLVHPHRDGGELDDSGGPVPDGPTPTGNAAELWLKQLSQQPISR